MNFLAGSFRVGRLFGIDVRVHILFLIWIAFRVFDAASSGFDWKEELLFLGMLFGIVLLHEFGHCFGARSVGGDAQNILMWPLGGLAYAHAPMRPWPQFVTVAAGPAVNVVLCLLSAAAVLITTHGVLLPGVNPLQPGYFVLRESPEALAAAARVMESAWFFAIVTFYHVNLFLLAFNLLPIYPLDGGQLFHALIWPFVGLQRASMIAAQVGLVGCVILGLWGLRSGGGGMLLFIAIFGGMTCWQRYQAARHGWLVEDARDYGSGASRDPRPWWQRIFRVGGRRRDVSRPLEYPNPNPGAWEELQRKRAEEEAELDRILRKVSERGMQSLSYVERQRLERITRARQEREREFEREHRS